MVSRKPITLIEIDGDDAKRLDEACRRMLLTISDISFEKSEGDMLIRRLLFDEILMNAVQKLLMVGMESQSKFAKYIAKKVWNIE